MAASWRGEVSNPPWVHGDIEAAVEPDAVKAATLMSTLAAATARAQALDEDLSAAEELMQAMQLESAGLNADLVKFAVTPSVIEIYTTLMHYKEPLRVGLTRLFGFVRLSCVGTSRNATQSAFGTLNFARTSKRCLKFVHSNAKRLSLLSRYGRLYLAILLSYFVACQPYFKQDILFRSVPARIVNVD